MKLNYSRYGAHNMFHLQGFATQRFLVYDAVINCKFTCIFLLLPNPTHQSTLDRTLRTHHLSSGPQLYPRASLVSFIHLDTSSKISLPVVVPCNDLILKVFPRMKIDSWAVSDVSARENVKKIFSFFFLSVDWWQGSHVCSATVFLLKNAHI